MQHVKEGNGWRLGWNPDATVFQGLVGGDNWAVEMTQAEFEEFCRLVLQLVQALQAMAPELMAEERIACEQETDKAWVEVEGFPDCYSLRFILQQGRRAEGAWPETVTAALVQSISLIGSF